MKFGEKLKNFVPYTPFEYKEHIRLDANESCFDIPKEIKAEIANAINTIEFNRYPDPYSKKLCASFADFYDINFENVIAGNGSDELINVIMSGILSKKDKVLVLAPDFSMYNLYCSIAELECNVFEKKDDYTFSVYEIAEYINKNNIDFFIFSNPCNPTGQVLNVDEVKYLLENCNCTVCVDEAYMDFCDKSILSCVENYENLIVLKTMSKNLGIAALRVGFAISCKKNIELIKVAKSPYNLNSFSQNMAEIILKNKDYINKSTECLKNKTQELYKTLSLLKSSHFIPFKTNTNFVYVKSDKAKIIYDNLLENNIVIRKFDNGTLRISIGKENEMEIFLKVLEKILAKF